MAETEIRAYAAGKDFHPQTLERWLSWDAADGGALERLAFPLKISENHLRDLMDWLEEVALRDGVTIQAVLSTKAVDNIATDPRLGRADKLKRIKEHIRRLRYPRLAEIEDLIRAKIQELKLAPEIRLSVAPGLEGGNLRVEFSAASHDELKSLTEKLRQAAEKKLSAEIFDLLAGQVK
jgi:tRNA G10  N-methylase Trm11